MSLIAYKMIAAFLIFLTSIISIVYPIKAHALPKHKPSLEAADAFASGIFLGAALFHMLPDAIEGFNSTLSIHYPFAELLCAIGFLILLFLERLSQCIPKAKRSIHALPYMLAVILIIHSLIEGTALGINMTFETAFVIFLAVIAHKSSESFALAVVLNPTQLSLKKIIFLVTVFSLMTPLGIALGSMMASMPKLPSAQLLTAGFNAFAAGTFLYMSTLHHINHHKRMHDKENLTEFMFLLVGLVVMAGLALWA